MTVKECSVDGCPRQAVTRGWCHGHYQRWHRLGDVQPDRPLARRVNFECSVDDCPRDAISRGLCRVHYRRRLTTGDAQAEKPVRIVAGEGFVHHGYRIVPVPPDLRHLSNGQSPYPEHRLLMAQLLGRALTDDESVHHVNGNRLDNTVDGPLTGFRSGNLELWSRWQPSGQRVPDKVAWALEILELYLPAALAAQVPLNLT